MVPVIQVSIEPDQLKSAVKAIKIASGIVILGNLFSHTLHIRKAY